LYAAHAIERVSKSVPIGAQSRVREKPNTSKLLVLLAVNVTTKMA